MKKILVCVSVFLATNCIGQGIIVTPLKSNVTIANHKDKQGSKRALGDTLVLPFFDDFTTTQVFPDKRNWMDKQVYVNSHFALSPPSYGVATFDNLNSKGAPYNPLSGNTHGASDSLTTKPINLKDYKVGVNTINYNLADSIFLSFFYQAQGLGDILDGSDSLVLKFKNNIGEWKTVWKTTGTAVKPFKQVLIGIKSAEYLFNNFQFRYINYTKNTGNMNQWHVDYIRMRRGRSMKDTAINDVAINALPIGPLKWYNTMPYSHYLANISSNQLENHILQIRNNFSTAVNTQYGFQARNRSNTIINNLSIGFSSRNIAQFSDSTEQFPKFALDSFTTLKYNINPLANDFTPSDYNSFGNNNELTKTLNMRNYFAYDDGTAEGGFGLDYGALPNGPGYVAMKFQAEKNDTLRGISIFFNRSVADVEFKSFQLLVWQNLSEPPASNTNNDIITKRMLLGSAIYKDTINGFVDIIFDTAIAISQGKFYIGWQQNIAYILNVGYDKNYQYTQQKNFRNPNVFYNLSGYWEKVSADITGTPMMRPIVGPALKNPASISSIKINTVKIYPNPSNGNNYLNIENKIAIGNVSFYDLQGKLVLEIKENNIETINVSELNSGLYTMICKDEKGNFYTQKYIKTQE